MFAIKFIFFSRFNLLRLLYLRVSLIYHHLTFLLTSFDNLSDNLSAPPSFKHLSIERMHQSNTGKVHLNFPHFSTLFVLSLFLTLHSFFLFLKSKIGNIGAHKSFERNCRKVGRGQGNRLNCNYERGK